MNGVHDMGGMQGFGPIRPEKNEPVFHARWEGRIHGHLFALGALGKWNIDFARQTRESFPAGGIPGPQLLSNCATRRSSNCSSRSGHDHARRDRNGATGDRDARRRCPPLTAGKVAAWFASGSPKRRDVAVAPTVPGSVSACAPAISTLRPIRVSRAMRAASSA